MLAVAPNVSLYFGLFKIQKKQLPNEKDKLSGLQKQRTYMNFDSNVKPISYLVWPNYPYIVILNRYIGIIRSVVSLLPLLIV